MDETKDIRTVLGETRKYIQWNFLNGSDVTWGSADILKPHVTVKQLESFAKSITNISIASLELKIKIFERKIEALKDIIKKEKELLDDEYDKSLDDFIAGLEAALDVMRLA